MTGWQLVGGTWYFLDGANAEHPGLMVSNCGKEIGGQKYFFNRSGAMYTGWALLPEGWYYTNGSGAMVTGVAVNWRHLVLSGWGKRRVSGSDGFRRLESDQQRMVLHEWQWRNDVGMASSREYLVLSWAVTEP